MHWHDDDNDNNDVKIWWEINYDTRINSNGLWCWHFTSKWFIMRARTVAAIDVLVYDIVSVHHFGTSNFIHIISMVIKFPVARLPTIFTQIIQNKWQDFKTRRQSRAHEKCECFNKYTHWTLNGIRLGDATAFNFYLMWHIDAVKPITEMSISIGRAKLRCRNANWCWSCNDDEWRIGQTADSLTVKAIHRNAQNCRRQMIQK